MYTNLELGIMGALLIMGTICPRAVLAYTSPWYRTIQDCTAETATSFETWSSVVEEGLSVTTVVQCVLSNLLLTTCMSRRWWKKCCLQRSSFSVLSNCADCSVMEEVLSRRPSFVSNYCCMTV